MSIKKQISQFYWEKDGMATPRFFGLLIGMNMMITPITIVGILWSV